MTSINQALRSIPPIEVVKRNDFYIFSSRDLTSDELEALRFHFHNKVLKFSEKYVILSPDNEAIVGNTGEPFCIYFIMSDPTIRSYVEKHREHLLSNSNYCFIKSFHESRKQGITWAEQLCQKPTDQLPIHSEIEFMTVAFEDFVKYLRSYSKIEAPEKVLFWLGKKLFKVFRPCICSG